MNASSFLLLICFVGLADGHSFFSGAFIKKIANISSITKAIIEHDSRNATSASSFLSKVIMTATEFPEHAEGSGVNAEETEYLPLLKFRKYASTYLDTVKRNSAMSALKFRVAEELRELRLENVRRKILLVQYMGKIYGTPEIAKYNEFEKRLNEVEKNVINFFALKSGQTVSSDKENTLNLKQLFVFFDKTEILDLLLSQNRYDDDIFIMFYRQFKTHAIFLTVSSIINTMQDSRELLSDDHFIAEITANATESYKDFLTRAYASNQKRNIDGFTFDNMFTPDEVAGLTATSILPVVKDHNLFTFNDKTEDYKESYMFLTVRHCGGAYGVNFNSNSVFKIHDNCVTTLHRKELTKAPKTASNVARSLRNNAIEQLKKNASCGKDLAKLIAHAPGLNGVIAVYVSCDLLTISDTIYTDDHTYKVFITLEAKQNYKDRLGEIKKKNALVHVVGYFMKPKNATY